MTRKQFKAMIYKLRLDEYRKCWVSTYYEVHADDIDTAVRYLLDDDPDHCEKVKDEKHPSELLSPGENMGEPTCKIVNFGRTLWDNSASEKRYMRLKQDFADEGWLDGKL